MYFKILVIVALAAIPFILVLQSSRRRPESAPAAGPAFGSFLERLTYGLMLLALFILAMTGIYSGLFTPRFTSFPLYIHVGAAPLFAIALTVLAVLWADRHTRMSFYRRRLPFWATLFLGMIVILTGVLPMLPFFSAGPQEILYETHRVCGVLVVVFVIVHLVRLFARA